MKNIISKEMFVESNKIMPGGVNSPVRAYGSVDMTPPFIARASGSRIYDVDGNEYIDYVGSWGPMILGHANKSVIDEISSSAINGTSFGAPTEKELILGRLICKHVDSIEMVRMVNSGTEAAMSAIRLARGYTKRDIIVKFNGCYHGHADGLLVKAGSGALTSGIPDSLGIPEDYAKNTLVAEFNDFEGIRRIFEELGGDIAGIIVEPIPANMGVVLPKPGYLELLRELTLQSGALLIFDEVITGFRIGLSCAQGYYGIRPDLTILGKIIGGGLPVGAYGGRREIMEHLSPKGGVYQAGTLSGNPLAMSAGIATLNALEANADFYKELDEKGLRLENGIALAAKKYGIPIWINRVGSLMGIFFNENPVEDFQSSTSSNKERFVEFFKFMIENGIYMAPSPYEAIFISAAHSNEDIDKTIMVSIKALSLIL